MYGTRHNRTEQPERSTESKPTVASSFKITITNSTDHPRRRAPAGRHPITPPPSKNDHHFISSRQHTRRSTRTSRTGAATACLPAGRSIAWPSSPPRHCRPFELDESGRGRSSHRSIDRLPRQAGGHMPWGCQGDHRHIVNDRRRSPAGISPAGTTTTYQNRPTRYWQVR